VRLIVDENNHEGPRLITGVRTRIIAASQMLLPERQRPFETTGHAVWSTTFIRSSFIRPTVHFDFRESSFDLTKNPQALAEHRLLLRFSFR